MFATSGGVRRLPVEGADAGLLSWADLLEEGAGVPPSEPIASWGEPFRASDRWHWSPQWVAAAGQALAHVLVASEGRAVVLPDGLTAMMFQGALDTLLPTGRPPRRAVLVGPGHPARNADADILLRLAAVSWKSSRETSGCSPMRPEQPFQG